MRGAPSPQSSTKTPAGRPSVLCGRQLPACQAARASLTGPHFPSRTGPGLRSRTRVKRISAEPPRVGDGYCIRLQRRWLYRVRSCPSSASASSFFRRTSLPLPHLGAHSTMQPKHEPDLMASPASPLRTGAGRAAVAAPRPPDYDRRDWHSRTTNWSRAGDPWRSSMPRTPSRAPSPAAAR